MAGLPSTSLKASLRTIFCDHYRILKFGIAVALFFIGITFFFQFLLCSAYYERSFTARLAKAPEDVLLTALIHLEGSVMVHKNFGKRGKVLKHISEQTDRYQEKIIQYLEEEKKRGNITRFKKFWIINAILVEGKSKTLRMLQQRSDVRVLTENYTLAIPERISSAEMPEQTGGTAEWGIHNCGIDRVWQSYNLKGRNVRIGHLDTGIDASHPDLAGKVEQWAEIDEFGCIINTDYPRDSNSHGTHTAGILVGGSSGGSAIGAAPDARLLSALVIHDRVGTCAQVFAGIEWVIDPDGNPETDDGVDIVNLSLGMLGKNEDFIEPVNKLVAADIFPAFAIGNSGADTSTCPGNIPSCYGIGAIDYDNCVTGFSGGEIVSWDVAPFVGTWIKPDIVAPGVSIKSSVPGGYSWLSGTSMATPFVAGTVALIREANPELSVSQIKAVLAMTARDMGENGKDIRYGWGAVDAYAAVSLAVNGNIPEDISEYDAQMPLAYIMSPRSGQSIWGEAVTIIAGVSKDPARVIFQYQKTGTADPCRWHTIGSDRRPPFSIYWDVREIGEGEYTVRVLPEDSKGTISDISSSIVIRVDRADADINESGDQQVHPLHSHIKTERIKPYQTTEILVADGTTVIIPAKTVSAQTALHIKHLMPQEVMDSLPPPEAPLKPVGIFREFSFDDGTRSFDEDITIFLPYVDDNDDGYVDGTAIPVSGLRIFYLDEDTSGHPLRWVELAASAGSASVTNEISRTKKITGVKCVSFQTSHFTLFAIMAQETRNTLAELYVYPNPVRPALNSGSSVLTFTNVTESVDIKIFTLAGRMVHEKKDAAEPYRWNMVTENGGQISSGIYFYVASDDNGNKATGKFAVIR